MECRPHTVERCHPTFRGCVPNKYQITDIRSTRFWFGLWVGGTVLIVVWRHSGCLKNLCKHSLHLLITGDPRSPRRRVARASEFLENLLRLSKVLANLRRHPQALTMCVPIYFSNMYRAPCTLPSPPTPRYRNSRQIAINGY